MSARSLFDTLTSLVGGMSRAMGGAKINTATYSAPLYTTAELVTAYRASALAQKVVNIPALDAFRRWRSWQAPDDQIAAIEAEEKRLGLKAALIQAKVKARLFGGAAIYISTGETDLTQPLDVSRIGLGGIRSIAVLPSENLTREDLDDDPRSPTFGKVPFYTLNTASGGELRIHSSRLIVFEGDFFSAVSSEYVVQAKIGWGDSVLQPILSDITIADASAAAIAALLQEARVDVIRIPDLMMNLMKADYRDKLLQRFALANDAKGINSILVLDRDEEYEQKTSSFAQLPEVLASLTQRVAAGADIPMTRLMGQSPGGLNSTGDNDLRNYYDRIQSMQAIEITPIISPLDDMIIASALGTRPADIFYTWDSLWQISDKERAEIGKLNAETIEKLHGTALFPGTALAKSAANMLVENAVMPGLIAEIEDDGGYPDYDLGPEATTAASKVTTSDAEPRSLYVRRDVINWQEIADFYRESGISVKSPEKWHVTVIHSRAPVDWFKIGEAWSAEIKLPAGGARRHELFGPPGLEDSLVLMIKSSELDWRNAAFIEAGCVSDYPEYQPHVTLAYKSGGKYDPDTIAPWQGEIVLGPEIFEEVKDDR